MSYEQLSLINKDQLPKEAEKSKRQPRKTPYKEPDKLFIFHEPMHLQYRWQVYNWIKRKQKKYDFDISEVLLDGSRKDDFNQLQLVKLFFFPQPPNGNWPNEEDVIVQITGDPKISGFRDLAFSSLLRIHRRIEAAEKFGKKKGQRAIEHLKPGNFLYRQLIKRNFILVDQIHNLDSESLIVLCGNRNTLEQLVECMQRFYPDWNPEMQFLSEKTPQKAGEIYFKNMSDR